MRNFRGKYFAFFFSIAVMNYRYAQNLKKITCDEFVPLFNQQQEQKHLQWSDVQVRILPCLIELSIRYFLGKYIFNDSSSL